MEYDTTTKKGAAICEEIEYQGLGKG